MEIRPFDRIMVLAPHPDDESLATAGLLQRARAVGAEVRVLFATDGENNPWPQRVIERRWRIQETDRTRWGTRRRTEALSALSCLGVHSESVRFLGYPDQGLCGLLMADPDPLLNDLVAEIASWRPSILIDPTPADHHPDHGALGVLTDFAVARSAFKEPELARLRYVVHGSLRGASNRLVGLRLTALEQDRKRCAIWEHQSQLFFGGRKMLRFVRPEERYLPVATATASDAGHHVTMCDLNRRGLRLAIGRTRRLGVGPLVIQLAAMTETGLTTRLDIPVPLKGGTSPARNSSTGEPIGHGHFTKSRAMTWFMLPFVPSAQTKMAYVKLDRPSERRLGFFDSMGWRAVPINQAQHEAEIEEVTSRSNALEVHEVSVR